MTGGVLVALLCLGCATDQKAKASPEERAKLFVEAANAALMEGDPTGALQYLKTAEDLDSDLPELHFTRAIAFHAKKDLPSALISIKQALKLAPEDSSILNAHGKLMLDAGKFKEAEKSLLKAAKDPTFRDAFRSYTSLGIANYRQGKFAQARSYLDQAIQENPPGACIAYYYKGHIDLKEARFSEATENYDRATQKFCAGFSDAHYALGIAYERDKQFEKARKKYLDVQQNFPKTKAAEQAMERLTRLP